MASEETQSTEHIRIPEGEFLGNCPHCGLVREDKINDGTAIGDWRCENCDSVLDQVVVNDEPKEVDPSAV